jgi:predicted acyl esterase
VLVWPSVYFGSPYPQPSSGAGEEAFAAAALDIGRFVDAGYAVVTVNVRGSGSSGGCFEFLGPHEQRDMKLAVDWAAAQSWSSGEVGMFGNSYDATDVLAAAAQNPKALRAVVTVAPDPDLYRMFVTPQGAAWSTLRPTITATYNALAAVPGQSGMGDALCPDVRPPLAELVTEHTQGSRDSAFWQARDLMPRLKDVRAAVLYTDGYYDDQYFEGDNVLGAFTHAPVAYVTGPWPHQEPPPADEFWYSTVIAWFDHWLKGQGPVPSGLGLATWQDDADPRAAETTLVAETSDGGDGLPGGTWHTSRSWPPPEAKADTLYLHDATLSDAPADTSSTYLSLPGAEGLSHGMIGPGGWYLPKVFLCPVGGDAVTSRLLFVSDAVDRPTLVAGNPALDLDVSVNQPGGIISARLLDIPPGFCTTDGPENAAQLSLGAADLEFRDGGYTASDFPQGGWTALHVDLSSIAAVIRPGHRVGLLISAASAFDQVSPYQPRVTVRGTSRLDLPVVS